MPKSWLLMPWGHWCLCILQGEDDEDSEDDIRNTYWAPTRDQALFSVAYAY